ncbi:MAG TPA: hypothetical protein VEY06_06355, partial [Flavisolibacter sp.]|nr:hypothetical protein [Flavisolibacter sp.]
MKLPVIIAIAISAGIISFSFSKNRHADVHPRRLEMLFLGHQSKHHNSELLADIFTKEFFKEGINITYTV